jgi:hypothetical protein
MLQPHKPWVREDDDILLLHVRKHGPNDWVRISQLMGHPSPQQCRERYYQYLSLALNNSPITPEEGVLIYKWKEEIGRQWPEIARRLGNRSSLPWRTGGMPILTLQIQDSPATKGHKEGRTQERYALPGGSEKMLARGEHRQQQTSFPKPNADA